MRSLHVHRSHGHELTTKLSGIFVANEKTNVSKQQVSQATASHTAKYLQNDTKRK